MNRLVVFLWIIASAGTASAVTIHVPDDFAVIQEAIDAAVDGDTIEIADGIYSGPGNYNLSFRGKSIEIVSSGGSMNCAIDCAGLGRGFIFNSGETQASIIRDITITNGVAEEGGGILCSFNAGDPSLIDLRIIRCSALRDGGGIYISAHNAPAMTNCTFSENTAWDDGGGAFIDGESTPSIMNCDFSSNSANSGGGLYACRSQPYTIRECRFTSNFAENSGGGVFCAYHASISLENCTIEGNSAEYGGGITASSWNESSIVACSVLSNEAGYGGGVSGIFSIVGCTIRDNRADYGAGVSSVSFITDSTIADNAATEDGGGGIFYNDSVMIERSDIISNQASNGAGLFIKGKNVLISEGVISGNRASENGGGVKFDDSEAQIESTQIIDNFSENYGGGIESSSSDLVIENSIISRNESGSGAGLRLLWGKHALTSVDISSNTASYGAGIFLLYVETLNLDRSSITSNTSVQSGGAITGEEFEHIALANCEIIGNRAGTLGSAFYLTGCHQVDIAQCSIVSNVSDSSEPASLLISSSIAVVEGCVIWNNGPNVFGGISHYHDMTIRYCIMEDDYPLNSYGIIHTDPGMIGGDPFNARLRPDSPCIDSGSDRFAATLDLDGNPRLQGGAMDIGAYESPYRPLTPHVTFSMPAHRFFPGDPASLTAKIWNPSTETIRNAPLFVILEYLDAYYFMPGGGNISFYTLDCPVGTSELAILPEFSWPDIPHSLDQALWYGAILDVGMTQMVSNVCVYDFDWRAGYEASRKRLEYRRSRPS